jgi:hypothetical protein
MSDLLSLISRLEAAKEGSRELDAHIAVTLMGYTFHEETTAEHFERGYFACWMGKPHESHCTNVSRWPAYTSSVDAALSHEAEGFWEIYGPYKYLNIPTPIPNRWRAVFWYGPELHAKKYEGWGATEALTRRIASLRARATT